jgi:hypothetical protein
MGTAVKQLFLEHPASVGESYGEHLRFAVRIGGAMVLGGLCCTLHAFLPFLFTTTGSGTVRRLHARLETHAAKAGIAR